MVKQRPDSDLDQSSLRDDVARRYDLEAAVDQGSFESGKVVVQREVVDTYICSAVPVRVVQDTADLLALYRAPGTVCAWPAHPKDAYLPPSQVELNLRPWNDCFGLLNLVRPGAAFSVSILWLTAEFTDWLWYVDVIRPYFRTRLGFDFEDLALDIVVARDLSRWNYKDEGELARLIQIGALTPADGIWIREVAHAAVGDIESGSGLFVLGWETWRPSESWTVPVLPMGWDKRPVPQQKASSLRRRTGLGETLDAECYASAY